MVYECMLSFIHSVLLAFGPGVVQRMERDGFRKFVPVLGEDDSKKSAVGDRGKLPDHVRGHVVLSPEGAVPVTSPGTESSTPPPPPPCHSLNDSLKQLSHTWTLLKSVPLAVSSRRSRSCPPS